MKKAFWIMMILIILLAITLISVTTISAKPTAREWTYTLMGAQVNYSIGERVTSDGREYECRTWDEGSPLVIVPPSANPAWWAEVQQ